MPSPPCDLLISAALIVTDWRAPILRNAAVAISQDTIAAVGPVAELRAYWQPRREINLEQQLLLPGLVNAQCMLGERLDDDRAPAEQQTLGIDLELLDLFSHGVTRIADTSLVPALVAQRCAAAGMRAQVAAPLAEQPNRFSNSATDARAKAHTMMDEWRQTPLITVAFGPALAGPLSQQELARVQVLADEIDAPVQIPLGGSGEPGWIAQLDQLGMLNPHLQGLYKDSLSNAEIELLGERQASIVYEPLACARRSGALTELAALTEAGCNLAIGTGSSALHSAGQLLSAAALAQHLSTELAPVAAIQQASGNGALALGPDPAGIAPLQPADLASFDLRATALQPGSQRLEGIAADLLRGGSSLPAANVWVAGQQVLSDQAHCTLNRTEILTRAAQWRATMAP
ncbi:MAG: amidohydrolase family protein [Pseudomonadales bacterium]